MTDAATLTGLRILLVEDDYVIATEMERWLRAAGAEMVGPVARVEQALDLIDRQLPDAAVLDVSLADGDTVYPLADRLDALGVPYLFATADVRVARMPGYRERPRLEQPFLERDLVAGLQRLLGAAQERPAAPPAS